MTRSRAPSFQPPFGGRALPWSLRLAAFGLIFLACLRAAWSTLDRYFLGDDFGYIARFREMPWSNWPALFVHDWSGGIWGYNLPELRPFAALTFLCDAHAWGGNPLGYHFTNLALHTGCAMMVATIAWRMLNSPLWLGAIAGILFACHPAHAEPLAWITGRVDLLGTLAYLTAFYAAGRFLCAPTRGSLLVAWLAYAIGCFSKEFCLTLPVLLVFWLLIYRPKTTVRRGALLFAGFVFIVVLYAWCRHVAFAAYAGSGPPLSLLSREYAERQIDHLRWIVPPLYNFGRDHRPALVAIAGQLVMSLLGVALVVMAAWRMRTGTASPAWRAALFFGLVWYAVATLPMAAASYFSPRHLYLATVGFSLATSVVIAELAPRRWIAFVLLGGACLFSARCFDHAISAWRHAAKLSERIALAVATAASNRRPGEALLLDIPSTYEGVWLWSWSTPYALQPPFMPLVASPVIEPPSVYFQPARWKRPAEFQQIAQAPSAVLISVDPQGEISTENIAQPRLRNAAQRLIEIDSGTGIADPELAWQEFLRALRSP